MNLIAAYNLFMIAVGLYLAFVVYRMHRAKSALGPLVTSAAVCAFVAEAFTYAARFFEAITH